MESLSNVLQPYKAIVGHTASVVTIAQFFSGAFVCKDIYQQGNTQGVSSTPFIGGTAIALLMLQHGFILNDPVMIQVNIVAIFFNLIYSGFYYCYSSDKNQEVVRPTAIATALVAVCLAYSHLEDPELLEYRYGMLMTVLMLALLAAPLKDLKEIIAKKDASSIPFPITLMASLTTFLWLLYGIIVMNEFIVIQNVVGFTLCFGQLILIAVYPKQEQQSKKKKAKKDN